VNVYFLIINININVKITICSRTEKSIVQLLIIAFVHIACTVWASRKIEQKQATTSTDFLFGNVNLISEKKAHIVHNMLMFQPPNEIIDKQRILALSSHDRDDALDRQSRSLNFHSAWPMCASSRETPWAANHAWRPEVTSKIKVITVANWWSAKRPFVSPHR